MVLGNEVSHNMCVEVRGVVVEGALLLKAQGERDRSAQEVEVVFVTNVSYRYFICYSPLSSGSVF